jgi:hypothetical protein
MRRQLGYIPQVENTDPHLTTNHKLPRGDPAGNNSYSARSTEKAVSDKLTICSNLNESFPGSLFT